jgi:hypothetical protein
MAKRRMRIIQQTQAKKKRVEAARKVRHHFAEGGLVPAMISPGEFVVNAQSAKANPGLLNTINSGRRPVYRAGGGPIGPSAASGRVGSADTQGGSVISLPGDVKSTLDGFVSRFSGVVDNLSGPADKLQSAADSFSNVGRSLDAFASSASSLADKLGGFNDAASSLAKSLANVNIPPRIEMSINGNYTVVLNGGGIFASMQKAVAEQVKNEILSQLGGQIQKAISEAPPR